MRFIPKLERLVTAVGDHIIRRCVEYRVLLGRVDHVARELSLQETDARVRDTLLSIGATPVTYEPTALDRAIAEHFGITREAFEAFTATEDERDLIADLALEAWPTLDPDVVILHRASYDRGGTKIAPSFRTNNGRAIPSTFTVLLRFHGTPVYIQFQRSSSSAPMRWVCVVRTPGSPQDFLDAFTARIEGEARSRLQGRSLNHRLETIPLKTYRREDLVYPPTLSADVDALLTMFQNWGTNDRIRRWGCFLIGGPGTGKTTIGGILAGMRPHGCTFLYCPAGDISSPREIHQLFDYARMLAPTVIQIDDVDLIAPDRRTGDGKALTSALMERLDGLGEDAKVFVVLTTNDPSGIEDAVLNRAGRVSTKIVFEGFGACIADLLDRAVAAFELSCSRATIDEACVSFGDRASAFTPDDMKNVCQRLALLYGAEPITVPALVVALNETYAAFHGIKGRHSYLPPKNGSNGHHAEDASGIPD